MARKGKVNIKELDAFINRVQDFVTSDEIDVFIESCAKELSSRLLAKVIKRTPVGRYPKSSGKRGGTLRRGWSVGKVTKNGDVYQVEIINPVEYAPYVEYGHRTKNHKGWVEGKFMLTISEKELQNDAPRILENKLKKKLGELIR